MKNAILICFMCCTLAAAAKHRTLNLQKALDEHLVKAKAKSLGGYQGYCINMNVKNLSADSLIILVEAGRRFNSVEDKYQDILVTRQEFITLKRAEEKNVKVKGYCCQASNHAPNANAIYEVNKLADSNLVRVARFLNANCFNANAEQQAIWAISDKKPTGWITMSNDTTLLSLRKLVATLKGEKLPWYSLVSGTYVYPNGAICNYPLWLRGTLEYSNNKEDYATLCVFNSKGQPVCMVKSEWIKMGDNQTYNFDIPVKNLDKGKYTIALKTSDKELTKKEFEI